MVAPSSSELPRRSSAEVQKARRSVEPALELAQRLGPEPAGDHPAVLAPLHPAGVLQDADVLADRGQRHGVRRRELRQAGRPLREPLDQPGAGRVAEGGAEDGDGHGESGPFGSVLRQAMKRDERGSALVELTWLGMLLLVPMLWIVLSVFEVQRGAFGVSSAARAAGRAYALAPDDALGAGARRAGGPAGAGRPGAARRSAHRDRQLHAVPPRLPPGHLGDHGPGRHPRRPAAAAGRARRQAPTFALDA